MLAFRANGTVALWIVDTLRTVPEITQVPIGEKAFGGDPKNPAVFLLERYFPEVPNTFSSLIPLAAHTVLSAECEFVEGLQIGIFTPTVFRVLTDEELKPYIELSKEIDAQILDLFRKGERLWSN